MSSTGAKPLETLRLSGAEKQKLIDYVEHSAKRPVNNERRGLRVNFFGRKVLVSITNRENQTVCCTVVPRNLSRKGMAFVHGRYIYADSPVEVTLPMLNGKWCQLKGVVRRCRHVQGIVHEVSVVFNEAIDLNHFVRLTTEQAERHLAEMTEDGLNQDDLGPDCRGRALVVDDLAADRRLFKLWLERVQFAVVEAGDVQEVLELLNHGRFDLFLIDGQLGEEDGVELVMHLRGQGVITPIFVVSASGDRPDFVARANAAGATQVIAKPLEPATLHAAVDAALSMSADHDKSPLRSAMEKDPDMAPLVADFVAALAVYVAKFRAATAELDLDQLHKLAGNLKGAGASHGFPKLTSAADAALKLLEKQPPDKDAVRRSINDLLAVIRRVQAAYN